MGMRRSRYYTGSEETVIESVPTKKKSENYRKIYEAYYGPIPKQEDGKTYEVHHLDGNHENNDPANLKAVTIQEHFDIHFAQEDYNACILIAERRLDWPRNKLIDLQRLVDINESINQDIYINGVIKTEKLLREKKIILDRLAGLSAPTQQSGLVLRHT